MPSTRLSYPPLVIGSDYSRHPIPGQQALVIHDTHNYELPEEPRMYHTIHPNAEADAVLSIPPNVDLYKAVDSLTGGRSAGMWLTKSLQRKGVCYVACWNGAKAQAVQGNDDLRPGFVIRRHNAS